MTKKELSQLYWLNREIEEQQRRLYSFVAVKEEYDEAWAEREIRRLNLESQNVPDYSSRGQYGGDEDIPAFEELPLTEREELGLGREHHEDFHGENGMRADDCPEPESRTYQAELSDPGYPDRMEIFNAVNDEDAIRQAYDFCEGEVVLLELFEMDDDFNRIRSLDIPPRPDRLTLEMPRTAFTETALENLKRLVESKAHLFKKTFDTETVNLVILEDRVQFPWFKIQNDTEVKAYTHFVTALCELAKTQKRVNTSEKPLDNERYAFRCFLLRLGFIGSVYKAERKILLSKLSGSSSYANMGGADDEFSN